MVESSTFGSEFIVMKMAIELIEALQYKLRMFGIPVDGPMSLLSDNMRLLFGIQWCQSQH